MATCKRTQTYTKGGTEKGYKKVGDGQSGYLKLSGALKRFEKYPGYVYNYNLGIVGTSTDVMNILRQQGITDNLLNFSKEMGLNERQFFEQQLDQGKIEKESDSLHLHIKTIYSQILNKEYKSTSEKAKERKLSAPKTFIEKLYARMRKALDGGKVINFTDIMMKNSKSGEEFIGSKTINKPTKTKKEADFPGLGYYEVPQFSVGSIVFPAVIISYKLQPLLDFFQWLKTRYNAPVENILRDIVSVKEQKVSYRSAERLQSLQVQIAPPTTMIFAPAPPQQEQPRFTSPQSFQPTQSLFAGQPQSLAQTSERNLSTFQPFSQIGSPRDFKPVSQVQKKNLITDNMPKNSLTGVKKYSGLQKNTELYGDYKKLQEFLYFDYGYYSENQLEFYKNVYKPSMEIIKTKINEIYNSKCNSQEDKLKVLLVYLLINKLGKISSDIDTKILDVEELDLYTDFLTFNATNIRLINEKYITCKI